MVEIREAAESVKAGKTEKEPKSRTGTASRDCFEQWTLKHVFRWGVHLTCVYILCISIYNVHTRLMIIHMHTEVHRMLMEC